VFSLNLEGKTIRYLVNREEDVSALDYFARELPIEIEAPKENLEAMFDNLVLSVDNTGENNFSLYIDLYQEMPEYRTPEMLKASIKPVKEGVQVNFILGKYFVVNYKIGNTERSVEISFWEGPAV
jgi:hypothetical protein